MFSHQIKHFLQQKSFSPDSLKLWLTRKPLNTEMLFYTKQILFTKDVIHNVLFTAKRPSTPNNFSAKKNTVTSVCSLMHTDTDKWIEHRPSLFMWWHLL